MQRFAIVFSLLTVCFLLPLTAAAQSAQPCSTGANAAATFPGGGVGIDLPPIDGAPVCAAGTREIVCDKNGGYLYTFSVTNNTGADVTAVLITPPFNSGYSINPQQPQIPGGVIHNGQSAILQVTITGGLPGQKICFPVTLISKYRCCTIEICVTLPNCCAEFNQPKITCNKDGSYSYTFTVTNKTPNLVQHIYLYAPAGTTITPSYFAVSLASGATSQPLTVTITGAKPGRFCFGVSLHTEAMKTCCTFEQCIDLPECGGPQNACANGVCCSRAPTYEGTVFDGLKKVAVVTGDNSGLSTALNFVVTVFDISGANAFGVNGNTPPTGNQPPFYTGPASKPWNAANLGSVFGIAMDHHGNIYVTASSAYNVDYIGQGGPGAVYRIDNVTGAIQTFAQLPNTPNSPNSYPGLGNIAFDCARKQLFVTNEDDGRIYRLNMNGGIDSTFDHASMTSTPGGAPEPGDAPGFAKLGERLWGVQVHNNRVYYSVWAEDCGDQNANPNVKNEIWSVGIGINGDFVASDRRLEISIPDLAGLTFSNPTSDISFSRDGWMLIAERTMMSATTVNAHASRVLEYVCNPEGKWQLAPPSSTLPYKYNVGTAATSSCPVPTLGQPANSAGGIDYDYDSSATYGVWATGDALESSFTIYGFQAFALTGGNKATSPLLALYGLGSFKMKIGDIEVSCPLLENPY